jgi:hypothetical protein
VSGASEYSVLVGSTPSSSDLLSTNTTNSNYTWTAKLAGIHARGKCTLWGSSNEVNSPSPAVNRLNVLTDQPMRGRSRPTSSSQTSRGLARTS